VVALSSLLWRVPLAILLAWLIWRFLGAMLRSVSAGGGARESIEPEDVADLEVFFVCSECGTEYQVTKVGEVQVPRHCGEPMRVERRPSTP
jgi:hypothetical protein